MASKKTTRRDFLLNSAAVAGSIVGTSACQQQLAKTETKPSSIVASAGKPTAPTTVPTPTEMPQRVLGRTAISVPIFGLGGVGRTPLSRSGEEREAVAIIERALELGIRYFDTAANYGPSEERLGKVLPPHRSKLFLASKTGVRDRDGAWRELERSLQRLKTDHLDLWQLHDIAVERELNTVLDERHGAIRAFEEAREQGVVRLIGITGHREPATIAKGLRRYPFDTVLIPINAADKHHPRPFITGALPIAQQKNVGVIAMKVPAYGRLLKPGVLEGMHQAMGYTLSQPGVHCCIIAAETVPQLEQNIQVARAFQPLDAQDLAAIERRTSTIALEEGNFFRNWV
ncbi:aldo/keto reductase [Leptolyngbya sp. FACHB-261]|uniref:aldo/keto reductase n=1 Tax=Leptolyngbya sp. FACHB-261 TaxID=2692806 RepID=UPI0016887E09|nr:aldo/keto reductase [Leptolyngbya sp. FACHB-261]MBD2105281.1 aldo/keto reductase [Leptolyngbya sp. FACHB-261]